MIRGTTLFVCDECKKSLWLPTSNGGQPSFRNRCLAPNATATTLRRGACSASTK